MSHDPNKQQQSLINSMDGAHLIDAGAGTGKTFTVSHRYANILEHHDVEPDDILLITFTRNAAEEMKERIINQVDSDDVSKSDLRDAPIQTFHSLCKDIVDDHGVHVPQHIGIDDTLSPYADVIENEVREGQEFHRFFTRFKDDHPEYEPFYNLLWDESQLLSLMHSLAAKGVFPTADGWYRNGEQYLDGDKDAFMDAFQNANATDGSKQSDLRNRLNGLRRKTLPEDAPDINKMRGPRGTKQIDEQWAHDAFDHDRSDLKEFLHDVYFSYVKYALRRNYLNFGFLQMFTFIVLCEHDSLRDDLGFEFVMVDEFQDTSEIQFKLTLLFANTDNICVVGDWKQSIYSFQYAAVDNIRKFGERIEQYINDLNQNCDRIPYTITADDMERIPLKKNYRSTQNILDTAEESLLIPATDNDTVDSSTTDNITKLEGDGEKQTEIEALTAEDEIELILDRIQELVDNEEYIYETDDGDRTLTYGDIAVLARNRQIGLELQDAAEEYNIPVAYEGGIELFKTNPAILLLAWLRILHYRDSQRGWAVVLEEAGYTLDEVEHVLEEEAYPDNMLAFREELDACEDIAAVARTVLNRYGEADAVADKLVSVLQDTFNSSYMNVGDIIRFMEECIEQGTTYDVDTSTAENMVTVQTIHGAKGLEYPAVIISGMNQDQFPNTNSSSSVIDYQDPIGLFQRKVFQDGDLPYVYDDWRSGFMTKCLAGDYDEERRLFYVAMTRAKQYLTLTAETENESNFFTEIGIEAEEREPEPEEHDREDGGLTQLSVEPAEKKTPIVLPVHAIMDYEDTEQGKGIAFGRSVHGFAERYANDEDVEPANEDEKHVKRFIDNRDGDLVVERSGMLPLNMDGRRYVLRGTIDLLHVTDDAVEIIDFKTDRDRTNEPEYEKQLSVYWHMVAEQYPDRKVTAKIFYTEEGDVQPVDVLSTDEICDEL